MSDEWHAAETSLALAIFGLLFAIDPGLGSHPDLWRIAAIGWVALALAIPFALNGLWIAWRNRHPLAAGFAAVALLIAVPRVLTGLAELAAFSALFRA